MQGHDRRRLGLAVLLVMAIALAWRFTPLQQHIDPRLWASWLEPYRISPLSFLVVIVGFVAGSMVMVPFTAMVVATLWGFGPWLGPPYVLAAGLCAALAGYLVGRKWGAGSLDRTGGARTEKVRKLLSRKGVLSIAVVRNLPVAPFSLVNLAAGAARLPLPAFAAGTLLGLAPGTIALAWLGHLFGVVR
jgi:uncharacterized membrane protein YdjX (TVP38/TMEM64 family)